MELIRKFKQKAKYNSTVLGIVLNKGSKLKPCGICGAFFTNTNCEKVIVSCDCNHERKSWLYTGVRKCGAVAWCPDCGKTLVVCC